MNVCLFLDPVLPAVRRLPSGLPYRRHLTVQLHNYGIAAILWPEMCVLAAARVHTDGTAAHSCMVWGAGWR